MPSAEQLSQTVRNYLATVEQGDAAAVAALYASDATVEDPVGGEVHIGRQAIEGFYGALAAGGNYQAEIVTLRALGHEAAFFWNLTVKFSDEAGMRISIISVMTFDDDAKITSMKAYWSQDDVTQL
jgi:steroid Delta-isomerase